MFDRHVILKKHYLDEIRAWDWEKIIAALVRNSDDPDCCEVDEHDGDITAYLFIGSVYSLTPSGKVYAPWTTNQTRSDETKDVAWFEALEEVCEDHDCCLAYPEGAAGDDIFIAKTFAAEESCAE